MKRKLLLASLAFVLAAGCNTVTGDGGTSEDSSTSSKQSSGKLSAESTSPFSVMLTWEAETDAQGYLVSVKFSSDDFLPLAFLAENQTEYEDFPAPSDTEMSYRVQAIKNHALDEGDSVTIKTPPAQPNPLNLTVNAFEPMTSFEMPTIDPNDPTSFDPSTIPGYDPETGEFDFEAFMQGQGFEPTSVSEEIGPEGGTLTITNPDGVTFTLTIPPDALPDAVIISLEPVESIEGFPLSGGMFAAVNILPDRLELYEPAVLTIDFPEEISVPEGMAVMNFSYFGSGYDFHFIPKYEDGAAASRLSGGKLLVTIPFQNSAGSSSAKSSKVQSVGVGAGTPGEMRETMTNNTPNSKTAQDSNQGAASQIDDELAPLVPPPDDELAPLEDIPWQAKEAKSIEMAAAAAGKPEEVIRVINRFKKFLDSHGDTPEMEKYNDAVWNELLVATKAMFEANKKKCLSKDDMIIQGVAAEMLIPVGKFWKKFADKFKAKYGSKLLEDISNHVKECKLFLTINSTLIYDYKGNGITATINSTIPLKYKVGGDDGIYVLWGIGALKYTYFEAHGPGCKNVSLDTFDGSKFILDELRPIFDANDNLVNFEMKSYSLQGKQKSGKAYCEEGVGTGVTDGKTGDAWSGIYTASHWPNRWLIDMWEMTHLEYGESGDLAKKLLEVTNGSAFPDGKYGENTTYTVVKKETKKE